MVWTSRQRAVGSSCLRRRVHNLGLDVPGNTRWRRILSAAPAGRIAPLGFWPVVLSLLSLEDRRTTDAGALANGGSHGILVTVRRKRRGLRRRTNGAFRRDRAPRGNGVLVDGFGGLVTAGRRAARGARLDGLAVGIRRLGAARWAEGLGRIGADQSGRRRDPGSCRVRVGLRLYLLKTRRDAEFAAARSDNAKPDRRNRAVDRGLDVWRGAVSPSKCSFDAFVGRDGVFDLFWLDDGLYGLHLYTEAQHRDAGRDLRVR